MLTIQSLQREDISESKAEIVESLCRKELMKGQSDLTEEAFEFEFERISELCIEAEIIHQEYLVYLFSLPSGVWKTLPKIEETLRSTKLTPRAKLFHVKKIVQNS